MKIEADDLIQFKSDKKKFYGFVKDVSENEFTVAETKNPQEVFTIQDMQNVIANYGKNPDYDSLKIDIFNKLWQTPLFGDVTSFREMTNAEYTVVEEAMKEIADSDISNISLYPIEVGIKPNKSKHVAGSCKTNAKAQKHEIVLCPEAFDKQNVKEILLHELAHAIWNEKLDCKMKAKWIRFYDKNIERKTIADASLSQLREDFINSGMQAKEYIKNMEDGASIARVVKQIKEDRNLTSEHIDILVKSGSDLKDIWPSTSLCTMEYKPFVSEYATKSVEEFFAESFSYVQAGLSVEPSVQNAVDKTVEAVKAR